MKCSLSGNVRRVSLVFLMFIVSFCACSPSASDNLKEPVPSPILGKNAQTTGPLSFRTAFIHLADVRIRVEIADTPSLQQRGLMFREALAEDAGMVFIYDRVQTLKFWMMNTSIPLSIGFFDDSGVLFEIHHMKPYTLFPQTVSSRPARYALEVKMGWFDRHEIKPGSQLVFESEKGKTDEK